MPSFLRNPPTWLSMRQMLEADSYNSENFWQDMRDARVIFHSKVAVLMDDFLRLKRTTGSQVEQKMYAHMDRDGLINRLITRRPVVFMTSSDGYSLRDTGTGNGGFEAIGKDDEKDKLCLCNLMSYDEVAIAALMSQGGPN